ncbi:unnamed protein product [Amaranthus hypochondriacus]
MEGIRESKLEAISPAVYDLPGEPAVVIDGVPEVPLNDEIINESTSLAAPVPRNEKTGNSGSDTGKSRNTGFGEWLEGREVRKLFDDAYYSGTVIGFDKETGWYRVVYEDGDFEDLEWHELQDVLQPLDITMPLKSLVLKIIRKSQRSEPGIVTNDNSERTSAGKTRGPRVMSSATATSIVGVE